MKSDCSNFTTLIFILLDINECANILTNNCSANATCTNFSGGFNCTCKAGFIGNGYVCSGIFFLAFLVLHFVLNTTSANCPSGCVNGDCLGDTCSCHAGWKGPDCSNGKQKNMMYLHNTILTSIKAICDPVCPDPSYCESPNQCSFSMSFTLTPQFFRFFMVVRLR